MQHFNGRMLINMNMKKVWKKYNSENAQKKGVERILAFPFYILKKMRNPIAVEHCWRNTVGLYASEHGFLWKFCHFLDFSFSKLLYPGLDARDYFIYDFYRFRYPTRKTFVTEGFLIRFDKALNGGKNRKKFSSILNDKAEFNRFFSDFVKRKWLKSTEPIEKYINTFAGLNKVIVKPLYGVGGRGVFIHNIYNEKSWIELYDKLDGKEYIIEEVLEQHSELKMLNGSSINTVRVYSVCLSNKVCIIGAIIRIGRQGKCVDNYHQGGLAAEIDIDCGIVKTHAISQSGEKFLVHPDSNVPIIGFRIPKWHEIVDTVKSAHGAIQELQYIAWDVVVCSDETITFIEANTCGGVDALQQPGLSGKKRTYEQFLKMT